MSKKTNLQILQSETRGLRLALEGLVKEYPEQRQKPDDRIFNRLLTNDWRPLLGCEGPKERRLLAGAAWVERFDRYSNDLREYFRYEADDTKLFARLPLQGRRRAAAMDVIRWLGIQERILKEATGGQNKANSSGDDSRLRKSLKEEVATKDLTIVAAAIGCNRDTLSDFLNLRGNQRKKTIDMFRAHVAERRSVNRQ